MYQPPEAKYMKNSHKGIYLSCLFLISIAAGFAQDIKFRKLSVYEKRWVLIHPIAAWKVKRAYTEIKPVYMQVKQQVLLDTFESGGKLDAFRHIYSMAFLAQRVAAHKLRKLGRAHEKGNWQDFIRQKSEEGERPDSLACVMDEYNNEIGLNCGKGYRRKELSAEALKTCVIQLIRTGKAWYLKRDAAGHYVGCNNEPLDLQKYKDTWAVPKCLIPSSQ